ncbi:MAG: MerR family transcriptional regulator [Candidatus Tectimicrobiota bacterium]
MSLNIPDKLFFKIGEVAKITGVKPHVLRYWESEFKLLKPNKSSTGQRVYQKKDVEKVIQIKKLLYDEKYTIAGAKRRLMRGPREEKPAPERDDKQLPLDLDREELIALLQELRKELRTLVAMLKDS